MTGRNRGQTRHSGTVNRERPRERPETEVDPTVTPARTPQFFSEAVGQLQTQTRLIRYLLAYDRPCAIRLDTAPAQLLVKIRDISERIQPPFPEPTCLALSSSD
jgi:hypothetical protein